MATLLLLVLAVAAHVRLTIAPYAVETAECPYPPAWWESAISVLALAASAIATCRAAVTAGIFRGFCTLPIPVFCIIACGIVLPPDVFNSSLATLCISLGTMFFVRNILDERTDDVLLGSLLFGAAMLFYAPAAIFVLMLPVMFFICPLSPRLLAVALFGWLFPLLAVSYVSWWCGNGVYDVAAALYTDAMRGIDTPAVRQIPVVGTLLALELVLLLLAGIARRFTERTAMLIRTRKVTQFVLLLLTFAAAMCALPHRSPASLQILAAPASIFIAFALDGIAPKISNLIYRLLVLLAVLHLFIS